jgi:hypothetical protein
VPRTISRFAGQRAADILLAQLLIETEGMVRYKILRGLGRMMARDAGLSCAADTVDQIITAHLRGIFQLLHWRVALEDAVRNQPAWRTTGYHLIVALLRHKEALAIERLFRVLGLRHRDEDVGQIYSGLTGGDPSARSSSQELLEQMLSGDRRTAIMGLVEELPDAERLAQGRAYYEPETVDPATLVETLSHARSVSVSCLAAFYAAQLGLVRDAGAAPDRASLDPFRERWLHPSSAGTLRDSPSIEADAFR